MRYRLLGATRITVSEIGFGAWGIGGVSGEGTSYGPADDEESRRALRAAHEAGITFYDTSDLYGYGHSEELIGEVFSGMRGKVVIASKVGFVKHGGPHDLSAVHIKKSIEGTLRRLRTDYVDVYQLHSPPTDLLRATPEAVSEMRKLKEEGKIRAFGVSVKSPSDGAYAIECGAETIQMNFNLIDQRALEVGLFDLAEGKKVGIIVRTPLAFGFLSGAVSSLKFNRDDHRSSWPESQLKLWAEAPKLFTHLNEGKKRTMTQLALKFCLSFPAVTTVVPGIFHPEEARENAAASDLPPLTSEEVAAAEEVYRTHTFFEHPALTST